MRKKKKETKERMFEVKGVLDLHGTKESFSKKIQAFNEKNAVERAMSQFGSKNKIKRRNILIQETKETKGE